MTPKELCGEKTVIGAAMSCLGVACLSTMSADYDLHWSEHNHAALKKQFATLFYRGGVIDGQGTIVVDKDGKHYAVSSMDDVIRVWEHGQIAMAFDMSPDVYRKIKDNIVLHPVPERQSA